MTLAASCIEIEIGPSTAMQRAPHRTCAFLGDYCSHVDNLSSVV